MNIRKYLFWALTLVLIIALVNLVLRGRRLEKQQAAKSVEVVQQSKPTPTRVLNPEDLEIVDSTLTRDAGGAALHSVEIRNHGDLDFGRIQLRFAYLDRSGKWLETKTHSAAGPFRAGARFRLTDIKIEGVPAAAAKAKASIGYADMEPAPSSQDR